MSSKTTAKTTSLKAMSKNDVIKSLIETTGLTRKQVLSVLDGLGELAVSALKSGGPGLFRIHGLAQLKRVVKPAQPARRGIDPFTKQERDFPAKPAKVGVRATALKAVKEAAAE